MSDTYDYDDTDEGSPEDSEVIRKLRAKARAEAQRAKELEARLTEVETAAQTRRVDAARQVVNTLGFPGLAEDVLNWVEGEITENSVIEALKARSLPVPDGYTPPEGTELEDDGTHVSASAVGQRLADAAGGKDMRDLETRIAQATSPAELSAIMAEAGLTRSHS
jgi:hypothetical protein